MQTLRSLINGEWYGSSEDEVIFNPSDLSEVVARVSHISAQETNQAIEAAKEAQQRWAAMELQVRAGMLKEVSRLILSRREELARTLSREQGKVLPEAQGEVRRAADIFEYYAAEVFRLSGENFRSVRPGVEIEISRDPLGVVGLISPWNFPIAIPAWKTAPALAYGNTVVLKPSEFTPTTAYLLAQIIKDAGIPDGVFNLVMGKATEVGTALLEHPHVSGVSFTGSSATGNKIAAKSIVANKKLQMEMGGKNALIVLDDADLDIALGCALDGAFFIQTGQRWRGVEPTYRHAAHLRTVCRKAH